MRLRKFKAGRIFDGYRFLDPGTVLITDESGKIHDLVQESDAGDSVESLEGILSPGFINCHCHLELSHLKNVIPPHTGLIEFLCSVVTKRDFAQSIVREESDKAEKEMYDKGIVAVGDIGNTADTAELKRNSRIRWHNFVEVLGFTDDKAEENINYYRQVAETFSPLRTSIVPHAAYSISPKTFRMIDHLTKDSVISVHNQEHPSEDELYKTGGGELLRLFRIFGMERSPFPVTGKSSIRSYLPYFTNGQTILLVHNTYMPEEDIAWANDHSGKNGLKLVYCLCVNANLYIENRVPPIDNLLRHGCQVVLGTDSYSSNWQLSIASEIKTVQQYFPHIELEKILQWATINGAKAMNWDQELGSFDKGKRPGIVLLTEKSSRRIL